MSYNPQHRVDNCQQAWSEPLDSANRYEVRIKLFGTAVQPPITADVTIRRLQRLKVAPNDTFNAVNIDASSKTIREKQVTADSLGLITVPGFTVTNASGNRLIITRLSPVATRRGTGTMQKRNGIRLSYVSGHRGVVFHFPRTGAIKQVRIYDSSGRIVRDLSSHADRIVWDMRETGHHKLAAGVYLCRGTVAGIRELSRLPRGCYIVRYGGTVPHFRRVAVPESDRVRQP